MKEQLIHILDASVCLSRRQITEYLSGKMLPIEAHAVEVHLNSCPLCRMAVEGFEENIGSASAALESLNNNFLKEHFHTIAPQIHLNSMAPTAALGGRTSKKILTIQFWRNTAVAATVLLAFGFMWYFEFGEKHGQERISLALNAPEKPENTTATSLTRVSEATTRSKAYSELPNTKVPTEKGVSASSLLAAPEKEMAPTVSTLKDATVETTNLGKSKPSKASREGLIAKNDEALHQSNEAVSSESADLAMPISEDKAETFRAKKSIDKPATALAKSLVGKDEKGAAPTASRKSLLETGDELFEAGKYEKALAQYNRQMQTGSRDKQTAAAIKAAKCYSLLGNKTRATELLKYIMETGSGADKRAARKVLRTLNRD
ncbi:MAG: zf-HC2 domain-containing protein [Chitinophagaceae bacterium]